MKYIALLFTFLFSLNCFAQPANDDCLNATTVVPDGSCLVGETTVSATDTWSGAVGCQGGNPNDHKDVWYSFTATGTQADITATASGSHCGQGEFDVHEGPVGAGEAGDGCAAGSAGGGRDKQRDG